MIVIADTSPINYLVLIDEVELLPALFNEVIIPQAVIDELSDERSPDVVRHWALNAPGWVLIKSAEHIDMTISLGQGEREAISLAEEITADLVLIDDRKARLLAIERGLNVAGTINILEAASKRGLVDLKDSFRKLGNTNFRISLKLLKEILDRN